MNTVITYAVHLLTYDPRSTESACGLRMLPKRTMSLLSGKIQSSYLFDNYEVYP